VPQLPEAEAPRPAVSLITTVKNESASIQAWLDSVFAQTRLPDEIVLVDGGSSDNTFETLKAFADHSPVPIRISQAPGANIARGRNLAIEEAAGPLIACTDAGCVLPPGWLAAITGPFAADSALEVVVGYYEAIQQNELQRIMSVYLVPPLAAIDPQRFLPSCRSMAFRKEAWRLAGGFPEWLTLAAEDTLFDLMLKERTTRWAFVPEAIVHWRLKSTLPQFFRQVRTYGRGDGEAGLFPDEYWGHIYRWVGMTLAGLAVVACLCLAAALKSEIWLLVGLLPAAGLARRIWQMTLRPTFQLSSGQIWPKGSLQQAQAFVLSAAVACTITLAQAIGFVEGVRLRMRRK